METIEMSRQDMGGDPRRGYKQNWSRWGTFKDKLDRARREELDECEGLEWQGRIGEYLRNSFMNPVALIGGLMKPLGLLENLCLGFGFQIDDFGSQPLGLVIVCLPLVGVSMQGRLELSVEFAHLDLQASRLRYSKSTFCFASVIDCKSACSCLIYDAETRAPVCGL
jgi:hypothetical protein